MFVFGLGLSLSVIAFLVVGAIVSFVFGEPANGFLPALIAGGFVFSWFWKKGAQREQALENPKPLLVNCSPEEAFEEVYKTLWSCHMGRYYWDLQPIQSDYTIRGVMRFGDSVCGMNGSPEWIEKTVRIQLRFALVGDSTQITTNFVVNSPRDRFLANSWIRFTIQQIAKTFDAYSVSAQSDASSNSAYAGDAAPLSHAYEAAAGRVLLGKLSTNPQAAHNAPNR